jgi:hypothetical protein
MILQYIAQREEHAEQAFLATVKLKADGTRVAFSREDHDAMQLLGRADRILPNGWCLLPPLQACGKGNACFSELCRPSCKFGCRTRSRRLHGGSRPAAADVKDRQRGEDRQVVEDRMSGFCGDHTGDMAAAAWQSGCFRHRDDQPQGRLAS